MTSQIFAISLPYQILEADKGKRVLQVITDNLLTPLGLRSLAPGDPDYRPTYNGSPLQRDSAYHQGTAWGWLIGAYLTALVRLYGSLGKAQARRILENIKLHFNDAGIGTISEIFDAEPDHTPRGCIAQAWSVAEILRAYAEEVVD